MADHEDQDDDSAPDASEKADKGEEREDHERDRSFRRLGDSLISSIWGDSSAAIKRGQGLVTGVAQGTKEELVRMISQEVRGFLDKMDAADLVQEIVSGLVIEMKTEIRFRRDESGRLEPDIRTSEATVGHPEERKPEPRAAKPEPRAAKPDPRSPKPADGSKPNSEK
ncbi:hypothetical protein DB30_04804 [Enhygromyxa salina]|uniref:Uncharacterized protein n=1 Tax=Enhygromyxa salina TaxID=215803 RepID=A0A0C2D8A8_9BACT|nr:hypothetical protein [Enhygromyxa salina]KIG16192.1 hypothetical protein DB30_04804 [Enhygromyxa salina]